MGSRLQQDLLSLSRPHFEISIYQENTIYNVCCVCVCAGQGVLGNAINLEIMNHLESGVRAHFDQILGRFHGSGPRANHRVSRVKLGIRQRQEKHKENTKAGKI